MPIRLSRFTTRFRRADRGLALLEFALALPVFLLMALTGAELCNYITVRMRVSQLALQMADNAARMGEGSQLSAKTVSETDINDVFIGGNMQGGALNLRNTGRVILSDLEADPNHAGKYKIMWQRCYGSGTHASKFGTAGTDNLTGIGPAGSQVTTQTDNATMFVEIYLPYKPLLTLGTMIPSTTFDEFASMSVRDRRDLTQIYNNEKATASSC
ncbi:pilus assembly protein [Sphingomonas sp. CGMCC 1.13654]|uniref:Pilus assembly protein n=1 Tax=Sphingomonas chungangi TaxID=2683589 RepID=A0A838LFK2_9SPHN|nr:TadE/TadG family type IV pilus assembly protein [Sphingomonas chungangi]MBA2936208.1 pilus assembly protein [Sphingomonas chungangi]